MQKNGKVQSGNYGKKSGAKSNERSKEHKNAAEESAQEGQDKTLSEDEGMSMGLFLSLSVSRFEIGVRLVALVCHAHFK